MASGILVQIWSDNGLVPDGTKPLSDQMLTYHQWGLKVFPPRTIPQQMLKISNTWIFLKITHSKLLPYLPGTNELIEYIIQGK